MREMDSISVLNTGTVKTFNSKISNRLKNFLRTSAVLSSDKKLVGTTVKVLLEGISEKKDMYFGYTDTNKLVNFTGSGKQIGDIVDVEIVDAKTWSLDGKLK